MIDYSKVDGIIFSWARKHKLTIYTRHQDQEVRSADVVSPKGKKYQIWIDSPNGKMVAVHAWDYKKQRQDWMGPIDQLANNLEDAIRTVESWTKAIRIK